MDMDADSLICYRMNATRESKEAIIKGFTEQYGGIEEFLAMATRSKRLFEKALSERGNSGKVIEIGVNYPRPFTAFTH